ncbi:MAG: S41 family peptidase [Defluviitaleaceae bacterium]|nr:S41 family peptidase [Defluviitaleaceae bacterium]
MKKKFLCAIAMIVVIALPTMVFGQPSEEQELIPLRAFFEEMGGAVSWSEDERVITVVLEGEQILIPLDESIRIYNDRAYIAQDGLVALFMALSGMENVTFRLTEEARDLALYDFDYMVNVTLENAVWDNIAYRRLGIPFDEHVAQFRGLIETMTPFDAVYLPQHLPVRGGDDPHDMAADYLSHLLLHMFAPPLQGVGHLAPRELTMYRILLSAFSLMYTDENDSAAGSEHLRTLVETYTHPRAVWFYGEYEVDFEAGADPFPEIPDNVVTEIITPGEIAYLGIRSFMGSMEYDDAVILPFLRQVEDYEHLILDVRGNLGGHGGYFSQLIMMRLMQENTEILGGQFFTSGAEAQRVMHNILEITQDAVENLDWLEVLRMEIVPSSEFVYEMGGMPYFNPDDLARLTHVLMEETHMFPYRMPEEERVNFNGKIWLLVDERSMSASVNAAMAALTTGFATVVGENTSGVTGPLHTYVMLPNTGIIWRLDIGHFTDNYGRSLEEFGVTPQIRNREGMDALETVLAVIAES